MEICTVELAMLFLYIQQCLGQEGFSDYLKRLKGEKQIDAKKSVLFTRKILGITNSQIGFPKKALIYTKQLSSFKYTTLTWIRDGGTSYMFHDKCLLKKNEHGRKVTRQCGLVFKNTYENLIIVSNFGNNGM